MPDKLQARTTIVANTTPDPWQGPSFRALESLEQSPLQFLAAGRWTANKGFDVLIDSWGRSAPGKLTVVGGPPPSGAALDVPGIVSRNPARDSITLVGEVDSIDPMISNSHVVTMPSTWDEPFGLVALEGMAAGRPVMASRVGGLAQFVSDEVGWLVDPGDRAAWASALQSVTYDEVLRKGAKARQVYLEKFAPQRFRAAWRNAVGLASLPG
jgi:glycosyltransferase involved in cell wall biosynthesis